MEKSAERKPVQVDFEFAKLGNCPNQCRVPKFSNPQYQDEGYVTMAQAMLSYDDQLCQIGFTQAVQLRTAEDPSMLMVGSMLYTDRKAMLTVSLMRSIDDKGRSGHDYRRSGELQSMPAAAEFKTRMWNKATEVELADVPTWTFMLSKVCELMPGLMDRARTDFVGDMVPTADETAERRVSSETPRQPVAAGAAG